MNTDTIRIHGRDFAVEAAPHARDGVRYTLTGERGASYATVRNQNDPRMMFLVNRRSKGVSVGLPGVWLTDASGSLKVVRS